MKPSEELKKISGYFKSNKVIAVILMAFVLIYLVNQDLLLNGINKGLTANSNKIIKLKSEIRTLKNISVSVQNEQNELLNLKNQMVIQRQKLKRQQVMLPKTFLVPVLIKNISRSSPASNFIIEKINFGKPVKFDSVFALPVSIAVIGGFNKSVKFVKNITALKRIFVINYISIKASKKSFPDIKADIKGVVFSKP